MNMHLPADMQEKRFLGSLGQFDAFTAGLMPAAESESAIAGTPPPADIVDVVTPDEHDPFARDARVLAVGTVLGGLVGVANAINVTPAEQLLKAQTAGISLVKDSFFDVLNGSVAGLGAATVGILATAGFSKVRQYLRSR